MRQRLKFNETFVPLLLELLFDGVEGDGWEVLRAGDERGSDCLALRKPVLFEVLEAFDGEDLLLAELLRV